MNNFLKNKIDLPEPKILHNSGNFAISVIKSSNFIGIHPKQMIETQKDKLLKILDIQGISMEPIYGITFLKNKPLRRACQLIIDELSLTSNDMIKQGLVKNIMLESYKIIFKTLLIGLFGGIIFNILLLPLPWMLGPAFMVAIFALFNVSVNLSRNFRTPFVGITGVWLGSYFQPSLLNELNVWLISLVFLILYVPLHT